MPVHRSHPKRRPAASAPFHGSGVAHLRAALAACAAAFLVAHPALAQAPLPDAERPRLQAVRAATPVTLDGRLDESVWAQARPATGFRQADPDEGEPSRLATEVRVAFDDTHLYVGAVVRDSLGSAGLRVPDLKRDFDFSVHDQFGVVIDPVGDGRFSQVFGVNPYGALRDQQVTDGTSIDLEWNALWAARTQRADSGWTVEMAIPWKTLRYPAQAREWRINFFRLAQRVNETSGWAPWPRAYSPYRTEYAGTLAGVEPPPATRNLRVQPYAVARAERRVIPPAAGAPRRVDSGLEPAVGGDAKWAIDPATVLDLTVNTDFAEADVDRQVVNLSRFSVRFPEQRQFFLENRTLFSTASSPTVQPFFTRRIGLDAAGQPIPIQGGARFTRRTAGYGVGALLMRQGAGPATDASTFAVGRLERNVGRQSRVGMLAVSRRDEGAAGGGDRRNTVLAADAALRFSPALRADLMVSSSFTGGAGGDGMAATAWVGHTSNRGYFGWLQHYIGAEYAPSAGFVYERDVILTSPAFDLDLRPSWRPAWVRGFSPGITTYFYHRASDRAFREGFITIRPLDVELRNSGFVQFVVRPEWQRLEAPFAPLSGMEIPAGAYDFTRWGVDAGTDRSARYNGSASLRTGGYFDGTLHEVTLSGAASPAPHAAFTLSYSLNRLRGVGGENRDTHLVVPGVRLALHPRAQFAAFYQHNTALGEGAGNARFSWEFAPLSFLHVVYNDRAGIDLETGRYSSTLPSERQLVVKLTWLGQL